MQNKFLLIFALVLTACNQTSDPYEPLTSGIQVQVLIGPMCPVVRAGSECPDQPYQATIAVLNLYNKEVLKFKTDEDGKFTVNLPPGKYVLRPASPQGKSLPYASAQSFEVLPNQMTQLIVTYDSGIR